MSATLKSWAYRRREGQLVETIECFDCGSPLGVLCRDQCGRECITCCQARADFALPILRAQFELRFLLAEFGLVSLENGLLP